MASLSEVYEGGAGGADLRRLYAGLALFAVGAVLTVLGIVVATAAGNTGAFGMSVFEARELAGVLAGIGLPGTFLGGMAVLPRASHRVRVGAVGGAVVAMGGVILFTDVYPWSWFASAWLVVVVYFVGALTTFWCLFVSVATFKARNDPGGTVNLEVRKQGRTRVVEVPAKLRGLGGIGFLGSTPDGEAETQTGGTTTDGGSARSPAGTVGGVVGSDGGTSTQSITEPGPTGGPSPNGGTTRRRSEPTDDAEFLDEAEVVGDAYCGNCVHFSYVRTDDGLEPYCGLHTEMMDDMDACSQWEPNT